MSTTLKVWFWLLCCVFNPFVCLCEHVYAATNSAVRIPQAVPKAKPVALVLATSGPVVWVVSPASTLASSSLNIGSGSKQKPGVKQSAVRPSVQPLQVLVSKQTIKLGPKARLAIAVLATGERRVYLGPARLQVMTQHVSVAFGPKARVTAMSDVHASVVQQWLQTQVARATYDNHLQSLQLGDDLHVLTPREGTMFLHRNPEMEFAGRLPREGSLMVFDEHGKRFWTQMLEEHRVYFPSSVDFDWGQRFTWEVRKATGGKVLQGSFRIASQATARRLLLDKPADLPTTQPEFLMLYAMRLHLAQAYEDAAGWWKRLGVGSK